jgi:hypothetical protein
MRLTVHETWSIEGLVSSTYETPISSVVVAEVSSSENQGRMGVPDPTGVLAPGVAESVPAFLFFFFLRGMRAGGFTRALRSDK